MAIYARSYRPYDGPVTRHVARPFILVRFSYARLFQSKFVVIAMALSACFPIVCGAFIYLSHNALLLALLNQAPGVLPKVDGRFFYWFSVVQGGTAYLLTGGSSAPVWFRPTLPTARCRSTSAARSPGPSMSLESS